MHRKLFVTCAVDDSIPEPESLIARLDLLRFLDTNEKVRKQVLWWLADEGLHLDTRFVRGLCDGFHIGGRFSGLLVDQHHDLWEMHGPDEANQPLPRWAYGHKDDAQVVTEALYRRWLEPFESAEPIGYDENGVYELDDLGIFVDIGNMPLSANDFVGQNWLILVDIHV